MGQSVPNLLDTYLFSFINFYWKYYFNTFAYGIAYAME